MDIPGDLWRFVIIKFLSYRDLLILSTTCRKFHYWFGPKFVNIEGITFVELNGEIVKKRLRNRGLGYAKIDQLLIENDCSLTGGIIDQLFTEVDYDGPIDLILPLSYVEDLDEYREGDQPDGYTLKEYHDEVIIDRAKGYQMIKSLLTPSQLEM